ncbi:uncharacterized protein EV422DRAFT_516472 [Fimicolochytrium jonesii]|uniref:uncharacterized protein n=1 Tax=Fimicolochytrium jonesii TaxID=1396493 RepID=UPI0022FF18D3|nr:uncharacterized protein EV422DRAFT_516472 [Fimicolochytrium jonesii]KAI8824865.1 hypothetical protein EV422DRAFT_516472 [Fimicolochytrium jonesii]
MSFIPDPETIPSVSYLPFRSDMARYMVAEIRNIAAGLATTGLASHADKIESGLNRMGTGVVSCGYSIRDGLAAVGIGLGVGLSVIGAGTIIRALRVERGERRESRRRRRKGRDRRYVGEGKRHRYWRDSESSGSVTANEEDDHGYASARRRS